MGGIFEEAFKLLWAAAGRFSFEDLNDEAITVPLPEDVPEVRLMMDSLGSLCSFLRANISMSNLSAADEYASRSSSCVGPSTVSKCSGNNGTSILDRTS